MINFARRLAMTAMAGAILSTTLVAAPAEAAMPKVPKRYSPVTKTIFNTPTPVKGTKSQAFAFSDTFVKVVNATPKGQWITVSTYSIEIPGVADALVKAHKRGVNVRFTVWNQRAGTPAALKLKSGLGTNINARSFFKACTGSCRLSGTKGINHTKVATISAIVNTKKQYTRYITFAGSANFSWGNAKDSWNNTDLFVNNKGMYNNANRYALTNKYDKTQYNSPASASGGSRIYYFPKSGSAKKNDFVRTALNKTSCKASKSTGYKGRTVVRVVMYDWTTKRDDIAKRLAYLKKKGCNVYVNISATTVSPSIINTLVKGKVPVYNGNKDTNRNGKYDVYQHGKTTIISGRVNGGYRNLVYSGSANFTQNSITDNTENMQVHTSAYTYRQHAAWFNKMIRHSVRIYKAPPVAKLSARTADADNSKIEDKFDGDFDSGELSEER